MNKRQPAIPLLIRDLIGSSVEEMPGNETLINRIFITPSGARVFRALISGVMMDKIPLKSDDTPLYKIRVSDPTGGLDIIIGKYDPEILPMVEKMECPSFVTVIGKVRITRKNNDSNNITLKPESITVCSREEKDHWLLRSSRDILARRWVMQGRGPLPNGYATPSDTEEPRGGEEVIENLDSIMMDTLRSVDRDFFSRALEMVRDEEQSGHSTEDTEEQDPQLEEDVLQMIRSMDSGDGARWDQMVEYIEEKRLSRDIIEEVISDLLDRGVLYEPVLGYLKTI